MEFPSEQSGLICWFYLAITQSRFCEVAMAAESTSQIGFIWKAEKLLPKQETLLRKLRKSLDGEDLQVMNSILAQFALYWEYR